MNPLDKVALRRRDSMLTQGQEIATDSEIAATVTGLHRLGVAIRDKQQNDDESTRRALEALDWLLRTFAPQWLEGVESGVSHAARLRSLPPFYGTLSLEAAESAKMAAEAAHKAVGQDMHPRPDPAVPMSPYLYGHLCGKAAREVVDSIANPAIELVRHECRASGYRAVQAAQRVTCVADREARGSFRETEVAALEAARLSACATAWETARWAVFAAMQASQTAAYRMAQDLVYDKCMRGAEEAVLSANAIAAEKTRLRSACVGAGGIVALAVAIKVWLAGHWLFAVYPAGGFAAMLLWVAISLQQDRMRPDPARPAYFLKERTALLDEYFGRTVTSATREALDGIVRALLPSAFGLLNEMATRSIERKPA